MNTESQLLTEKLVWPFNAPAAQTFAFILSLFSQELNPHTMGG